MVQPVPDEAGKWADGRLGMRQVQVWLAISDAGVIFWAVLGAQVVRFGVDGDTNVAASIGGSTLSYTTFSITLALVWWLSLRFHGVYAANILGHGAAEYRLLATGTLRVFAAVALVSFALQIHVARGYILLALPAGLLALFVSRRMWRLWLGRRRQAGELNSDVLVVGDPTHVRALLDVFASVPEAGYQVVGVCTTDDDWQVGGVPRLGSEHDAAKVAIELGVDIVACTVSHLGTHDLRRLGWAFEGSSTQLVVAPGLTEVAGPRILTRPVAGLPLLHVEPPTFSGPKWALKSAFDWFGALALVVAFSPLLLVVAVIIKLQDGGPVFFRQERVGLGERTFQMTKFRSMAVDAEARLVEVRQRQMQMAGDGPAVAGVDRGVLFKMEDDPRVTPFGRWMRRYSIDELPQLFDVLAGRMSLVGPRPPLPSEVLQYGHDVHRRLLVKPGMTGLWQINGRSDLSWEEAVRFDLYYVDNWSITQDLIILWRTAAAVKGQRGAY